MEINVNPKRLYEGCIFAAIAHAVAVGKFPELNYEHSWDGINYCMNDSQGCRATITFHEKYIIAVFQDADKIDIDKDALEFFDDAPDDVIEIACNEALQYVLEDVDSRIKPVITAAFWGTWDKLYSVQPFDEIVKNGGHIIHNQLLSYDEAMAEWRDYYDLDEKQNGLIKELYDMKKSTDGPIFLDSNDGLYGDMEEITASLGELNIFIK